jgi:hypothetical protein
MPEFLDSISKSFSGSIFDRVYEITADSVPDYDEWGPDSYWACTDWVKWHKVLKAKYGADDAKSRFGTAWGKRSAFGHELSCSLSDTDFINYFKSEGFTWNTSGSMILSTGQAVKSVAKAVDNVAKATENLTKSASNISKYLLYAGFVIAVLAAGYIVYHFSKKL